MAHLGLPGMSNARSIWSRWRKRLHVALAGMLAGCQALPLPPAGLRCDTRAPKAPVALRQVATDTVGHTVRRPGDALGTMVRRPVQILRHSAAGLFRKRVGLCLSGPPDPVSVCRSTLDAEALEAELRRVVGNELHPANIQLYTDGCQALAALENSLNQATQRIDVIMFLWGADALGWHMARRLAARASPNLPVRILVDGGGNLLQGSPNDRNTGQANAAVCWLARQPHVQVIRTRNPCFRFDHRKLVLVDGRVAWSGGRNFTHEAFCEAHDLSYTLTGTLTSELTELFERFWQEQGGRPCSVPTATVVRAAETCNSCARLVQTQPHSHDLAQAVYTAVDQARHHVYLENPYFGDNRLFVKLMEARRRGVDVRAILTLDTGVRIFDISNRAVVNRMLRAGIRIYLYPGRMHVKAMAVDGSWAYFGTGNFDSMSLHNNRELGLAVSHGQAVAELEERLFQADLRPEWEVTQPLPLAGYESAVEAIVSLIL